MRVSEQERLRRWRLVLGGGAVDAWVAALSSDSFEAVVALLRRTFGAFEPAERRQLGGLLATGRVERAAPMGDDVDEARATAGLATVRAMLGLAPREVS